MSTQTEQVPVQTSVEKPEEKPQASTETKNEPSKLDPIETKRLQAMLGNPKQQQAKYFVNESGKKEEVADDSIPPQATILFKNCDNCEYVINSMCTKVVIDSCTNTKITLNKKIITSTVDVYKSENLSLDVSTKVGTLQLDVCKKLNVVFQNKEMCGSVVWAGVHDLVLNFTEGNHKLETGFEQMEKLYGELRHTIDQFIIRWVDGKLLTERLIRLENGYPTTEREKKIYDDRQEAAIQKLAKEAGITIGKKSEKKIPPNAVCPKCKSGKKYKKCCGKNAP